jgi:hypothetical protein
MKWRNYTFLFTLCVSAIFIVGCGDEQAYEEAIQEAYDDLVSMVHETVAEPDRSKQVIELLNQNHDSYRELYVIYQEYHAAFRRLNAEYDATPEQFKELSAEYSKAWTVTRNRLVVNLFEMKHYTTEDEWNDMIKQFKKYMNQRIEIEYAK